MMQQYLAIKDQYADAIVLYRMGDFYEMFFEDAETASRVLDITLTSRNKNDDAPVPMCGVPYRAVQGYIARLLEQGHKVAVCDQVEDPAKAKGLVKREVVRVITPGMIVENEFLNAKENNYLLAAHRLGDDFGLATVDLSTGGFRLCQSKDAAAMIDEVRRVDPSETLLAEELREDEGVSALARALGEKPVTWLETEAFNPQRGRRRLLEQFNTVSLEGFGCEGLQAGIAAAGALLFYIRQTQKQDVAHLRGLETYRLESYLWLDDVSVRNLELFRNLQTGSRRGTLVGVIDRTVTSMGGRLLNHWLRYPLTEVERIERRLAAVDEALDKIHTTAELREALKNVADLERLGSKIVMAQCNARDLIALKRSLQALPELWSRLAAFESALFQWRQDLSGLYELGRLIEEAIRDDAPLTVNEGGLIRSGFDDELDELMAISADGKGWLVELERREKASTGITTLKVRFNKVFGYYIEVPKSRSGDVPAHYVRKQTLVNSERYITDELKKFEMKVLGAEERRAALEYRIFSDIRKRAAAANGLIQDVARFLARLDCLLNLAFVAERRDYCRPRLNEEGRIHIEDGRHPVVETLIAGERFVPNSITLDDQENQVLIITGPNMAGKSTVLRQVALSVVLAQMGSFVPAAAASLAVTDRIFTRVGALDNLSSGQSTFLVEMQETANILNNATGRSLVIMDEIGRGTSTFDGLSIAWAVAAFLHDLHGRGVKTLFATHYHELTELARTKARVKNFNIAVKEWNEEIIFLRKLVAGGTNRSYGIQVARLAGIPGPVIRHARKVLAALENGDHHLGGLSARNTGRTEAVRGAVQLQLFERPEKTLLDKLRRADIARMTPLDALNWLNELQQQAREL